MEKGRKLSEGAGARTQVAFTLDRVPPGGDFVLQCAGNASIGQRAGESFFSPAAGTRARIQNGLRGSGPARLPRTLHRPRVYRSAKESRKGNRSLVGRRQTPLPRVGGIGGSRRRHGGVHRGGAG